MIETSTIAEGGAVGDRLAGKVAIITGGARGQGEAEVRRFVAEGARVAIIDVLEEPGELLAKDLGDQAVFHHLDVSDAAGWDSAVTAVLSRWQRLDILINNAGIGVAAPVDELPLDAHDRMLQVNLNGVYFGIRAATRPMKAQHSGSIVNVSSIAGLSGQHGMSSYSASKFAVTGMTRSLAPELGPFGIRINSVHPGIIDTPMAPPEAKPHLQRIVGMQPIPRLGRPEEVASVVLFVASDEASYMTGTQILVDGGHLAGPFRPEPVTQLRD
jgi:3alpha(or 20beta)-hydroxysteroid dehydrogenase